MMRAKRPRYESEAFDSQRVVLVEHAGWSAPRVPSFVSERVLGRLLDAVTAAGPCALAGIAATLGLLVAGHVVGVGGPQCSAASPFEWLVLCSDADGLEVHVLIAPRPAVPPAAPAPAPAPQIPLPFAARRTARARPVLRLEVSAAQPTTSQPASQSLDDLATQPRVAA